jgi:hypothetical protein
MRIPHAAVFGVSLFCLSAPAQPALEAPQLGTMLDHHGAARPLYGVAASVTLGAATATNILAIACSRRWCLMKTDSTLLSPIGAAAAPPGHALIALDGGSAFVYFTRTRQLARWHEGQLDPIPWEFPAEPISDEILSIRAGPAGTLDAAVRRDGSVSIARITLADGSAIVTGSLPDGAGPVLLHAGGIIFADGDKIVLRHPDGSELSFPVTGAQAIFLVGDRYAQIRAGNFDYALRVDPGREQLFLLPEAVQ